MSENVGGVLPRVTMRAAARLLSIIGVGVFVGFQRAGADILGITVGPSVAALNDSFAIDDLRVNGTAATVPEPATLVLLGTGAIALLQRRMRKA